MCFRRAFALIIVFLLATNCIAPVALAGGPRWVAGSSYFDPATLGRPIVWNNGVVDYYTDLGDLSPTVTQAQANAMVAAAAALWSGVPTAALQISAAGSLAEDVNSTNFFNGAGGLTMPTDVQSSAIGTPLGIIYDSDGSVLDALQGDGASDPTSCNTNAVTTLVDNFSTDAKIAHALMIVNGLCTADANHVALVQYELLRGFGRILGLDWSQANDQMFPANTTPDGLLGWPLMHPVEKLCNSNGNPCMTGTIAPRTDDVAALNRLYPITTQNSPAFAQKLVTATATISIQGTIRFQTSQGMQGVNVVARPLIAGTDTPDMRYPAAAVSGQFFIGNAGNPIDGIVNNLGLPYDQFGTTTATLEGWYDLSGIPLPPGVTQADYQLTFEPINPLYTGDESVGPYSLGQVTPSGTMPTVILRGLTAGSATIQDETIANSATDVNATSDGTESGPASVPVTGQWTAQLSGYGHDSWFTWPVRGGRQMTLEAQPLDERGAETTNKARIVTGVWNGSDAPGTPPDVSATVPFNATPPGLTTLSFETGNDGTVRAGLADQRGDGRPDYGYAGRVLYADTVTPAAVSVAGGPIVINGIGFRPGNLVTIGGIAAQITSTSPMEITAIAPPSPNQAIGNIDVTVTDTVTGGWTTIEGSSGTGLSYGPQSTDEISIVTAPANAVPMAVPLPFTVKTLQSDGVTPATGITVTFTVTNGLAGLGCGQTSCATVTNSSGVATINVTAQTVVAAQVTASLASGAGVATSFTGAVPPTIAAISAPLSLAAGAVFNWSPQAVVTSNGVPYSGQSVTWSASSGATVASSTVTSNSNGLTWTQLTAGPLTIGANVAVKACLTASTPSQACAQFTITGVDPTSAGLIAVRGTNQTLTSGDTLAPAVLQVLDLASQPLAGATVNFYETLRQWTPPCTPPGVCPTAPTLATQQVQAISDANGMVSLTPLTDGIVATRLEALAVTGDSATITIAIERHP